MATSTTHKKRIRARMARTGETYNQARRAILHEPLPEPLDDSQYQQLRDVFVATSDALNRWRVATAGPLTDDQRAETETWGDLAVIDMPRQVPDRAWFDELYTAADHNLELTIKLLQAGYEDIDAAVELVAALDRWTFPDTTWFGPVTFTLDDLDLTTAGDPYTSRSLNVAVHDRDTNEKIPVTVAHQQGLIAARDVPDYALLRSYHEADPIEAQVRVVIEPVVADLLFDQIRTTLAGRDRADYIDVDGTDYWPGDNASDWFDELLGVYEDVTRQVAEHSGPVDPPGTTAAVVLDRRRTSWPSADVAASVAMQIHNEVIEPLADVIKHAIEGHVSYDPRVLYADVVTSATCDREPSPEVTARLRDLATQLAAQH